MQCGLFDKGMKYKNESFSVLSFYCAIQRFNMASKPAPSVSHRLHSSVCGVWSVVALYRVVCRAGGIRSVLLWAASRARLSNLRPSVGPAQSGVSNTRDDPCRVQT